MSFVSGKEIIIFYLNPIYSSNVSAKRLEIRFFAASEKDNIGFSELGHSVEGLLMLLSILFR